MGAIRRGYLWWRHYNSPRPNGEYASISKLGHQGSGNVAYSVKVITWLFMTNFIYNFYKQLV